MSCGVISISWMVGMGKKRIFSKRLPLSSKTKREVRWYSPEICPPHAMVWMTASRLNSYSFKARRNSVSFCAIVRMMRSTFAGAPERLTTGESPVADAFVCARAAALSPLVQEALDGPTPAIRVVERELVDPHRDEAVGQLRVHVARELHGVGERVAPVVERVAYGLVQVCGDASDGLRAEFASDTVSAHRQRQVCPLLPPLSEVYDLVQPELLVEELPLVYEQPRVGAPLLDGLDDAVEGDDLVLALRAKYAQREASARQRPRHGDLQLRYVLDRMRLARDDDGAVALAD